MRIPLMQCPRCTQKGLYHNSLDWVCLHCGCSPVLSRGKWEYARRRGEGDSFNSIAGIPKDWARVYS